MFMIVLVVVLVFCGGCAEINDTPPEMQETNVTDVSLKLDASTFESEMVVIPVEEVHNYYTIATVDGFVELLNENVNDVDFEVVEYESDYFDEYFGIDVDESAYIVGTCKGFELYNLSLVIVDDEVYDFTMTVNVENTKEYEDYASEVEYIIFNVLYNFGVSESEFMTFMDNFTDFGSYKKNVYDNPEKMFIVSDIMGWSVIFEGGKDVQFDGTSYYLMIN